MEIVLKGLCSEKASVKRQFVLPSLFAEGSWSWGTVSSQNEEGVISPCVFWLSPVCSVAASFYSLITKCLRPQKRS